MLRSIEKASILTLGAVLKERLHLFHGEHARRRMRSVDFHEREIRPIAIKLRTTHSHMIDCRSSALWRVMLDSRNFLVG